VTSKVDKNRVVPPSRRLDPVSCSTAKYLPHFRRELVRLP
jgi:hypothetical protein